MHLMASVITRAFNEDGLHARYVMMGGGAPAPEGITVNLSPEERRVAAEGLAWLRDSLVPEHQDYALASQLGRRLMAEFQPYSDTVERLRAGRRCGHRCR